jgi:hypothetical protein
MVLTALTLFACIDNSFSNMPDDPGVNGARIEVTPSTLNFGTVRANGGAGSETFIVRSIGTLPVELEGLEIRGDVYGDFTLLSDPSPVGLQPGDELEIPIVFAPSVTSEVTANVLVTSSDEVDGLITVQLVGSGLEGSLTLDPNPLDFGTTSLLCDQDNGVTLSNDGASDISVTGLTLDGAAFELPVAHTLPFTLAAGQSTWIDGRYLSTETGNFTGELLVESDDPGGELVGLWSGTTGDGTSMEDAWTLPTAQKSDIIFSVDHSCSMGEDQLALVGQASTFINYLDSYASDWQIIVASDDNGCNAGGILDSTTANYQKTFEDAVFWAGLFADWTEALLSIADAAVQATDAGECNFGFLRPEAILHVISVSDEPEQSVYETGRDWADLVAAINAKKGDPSMVKFSAIAGDYPGGCATAAEGDGYWQAVNASGGVFLSICSDWATPANMALLADASVTRDTFQLSGTPVESTIVVEINGSNVSDWMFDAGRNSVVILSNPPEGGDTVVISYDGTGACD